MRATDLQFRSPKEKTPDFLVTQVTFDGRFLPMIQRNQNQTFSKATRFRQYEINAKRTRPGPGSYDLQTQKRICGTPAYYSLHGNRDTSDNGFFFFGQSLVYEPSFVMKNVKRIKDQKKSNDVENSLKSTNDCEETSLAEENRVRVNTCSPTKRKFLNTSPYSEKLYKKKAEKWVRNRDERLDLKDTDNNSS
jgi:hypothetical protein